MLAGAADLIDRENLKFHFARFWRSSLRLEEAWPPSVMKKLAIFHSIGLDFELCLSAETS